MFDENLKQIKFRYQLARDLFVLVNKKDNSLAKINYQEKDLLMIASDKQDASIFYNSLGNKDEWDILKVSKTILKKTIDEFDGISLIYGANKLLML